MPLGGLELTSDTAEIKPEKVKRSKGGRRATGLRREEPWFQRFTKEEYRSLIEGAKATGLDKAQYARCKLFDYPFETYGGHKPRRKTTPDSVVPTHSIETNTTV